jgi:hypothetical protein
MPPMSAPQTSRSAGYTAAFEAAQSEFIRLVESLTDEQWREVGRNYPQRLNDEDEQRSVGVIAHHVAVNTPWIMERIEAMLEGRPLQAVDIGLLNARHAAVHGGVTRAEVLQLLREQQPIIAAAVRAVPDEQLDQSRETPAGPMSVAQRLERVLIGHMKQHQGSIEATIR